MIDYAIISIDDSRFYKKVWIRQRFIRTNEAQVDFVNGKIPSELLKAKNKWNDVDTPGPFKAGEFGIFYSVLNCLEYGANNNGIVYFEDDAMPCADFEKRTEDYLDGLPEDADLLALWSPTNQQGDYMGVSGFNAGGEPSYEPHQGSIFDFGHDDLTRLWQGYGNVGMAFTKQGSRKALDYIKRRGFFSPIDCLLCIASHTGELNSYSLKPGVRNLIDYDWNGETTIHKSKWGSIQELTKENGEANEI